MFDKYLVTGATGFLGRAVAEELVRRKRRCMRLCCMMTPIPICSPKEVRTVIGDVCDKKLTVRLLRGCRQPYLCDSLCWYCLRRIQTRSELYQVNVGGTWKVLRQCMEHDVGKNGLCPAPSMPYRKSQRGLHHFGGLRILSGACGRRLRQNKAAATELVFDAAGAG